MRFIFILNIFVFSSSNVSAQTGLPLDGGEQFINSTIKIQSFKDTVINGIRSTLKTSTGTGFFFAFISGKDTITAIVTNSHVVKNYNRGKLKFNGALNGKPNYGDVRNLEISRFNELWLYHPTQDLAILPLNPMISFLFKKYNKPVFLINLPEYMVASKEKLDSLVAIEDVFMIGFPKGFGDSLNNLPIVRKGITATPAYLNYNGLPQFLVDIPIYSGSSGSPVVIYGSSWLNKAGSTSFGMRAMLLGIVSQSQDYIAKGTATSPFNKLKEQKVKTETSLPFNIAIVIKATELSGFLPQLEKLKYDQSYLKLLLENLE